MAKFIFWLASLTYRPRIKVYVLWRCDGRIDAYETDLPLLVAIRRKRANPDEIALRREDLLRWVSEPEAEVPAE
jgi:hypothetical protein